MQWRMRAFTMARNQQKNRPGNSKRKMNPAIEEDAVILEDQPEIMFGTAVEMTDGERKSNAGARQRLGGHTGGDFDGGGKGPALGETHPADDASADHYGSREETQAALEGKIASQNTLKLHGRL
jgi:hypothetical protein